MLSFFTIRVTGWWLPALVLVAVAILLAMWYPRLPWNNVADAVAVVRGGPLDTELSGTVRFFNVQGGTRVEVKVIGLPPYMPARDGRAPIGPHGFHVHEVGDCTVGDPNNPFQAAGGHYNPTEQPHGNHAGDFPVLFSNGGLAEMSFFTNAFRVQDLIEKSVIIHENPDDFRSQPSGNSGKRLGCGVITAR